MAGHCPCASHQPCVPCMSPAFWPPALSPGAVLALSRLPSAFGSTGHPTGMAPRVSLQAGRKAKFKWESSSLLPPEGFLDLHQQLWALLPAGFVVKSPQFTSLTSNLP